MLNHLHKFDYYQILIKNKSQQISYAARKDKPEQKVVINQLSKSELPTGLDVTQFIQTLKHLVMLEEDPEHWYIITEQISGHPMEDPYADLSDAFRQLPIEFIKETAHKHFCAHIQQLLTLCHHYDRLGHFWVSKILSPANLRITESGLESVELIVLGQSESEPYDQQLIHNLNEIVDHLTPLILRNNLEPQLETIKKQAHLKQWLQDWELWLTNEMNQWTEPTSDPKHHTADLNPKSGETIEPIVLDGLFAKEPESAHIQRRQNDLERKQLKQAEPVATNSRPTTRWPLALVLFVLIAVAAYMALPNLVPAFKAGKDSTKPSQTQETTNQQSQTLPPTSSSNQLTNDHMNLEGNTWVLDPSNSHTGTDAVRLDKVSSMPTNQLTLTALGLKHTASLSFWMMTSPAGKLNIEVQLYNGKTLIDTIHYAYSSEMDHEWSLVTPLLNYDLGSSEADKMVITFKGDVDSLWIDDLSVDSYK